MTDAKEMLPWLLGKQPWPDELASAAASPGPRPPGDFPDDPTDREMCAELTWQVVVRVSAGRTIPPPLQKWFNAYVANDNGKRVRTTPPDVEDRRRMAVAFLKELYGLSQAEAVRTVAAASGQEPSTVATSLRRPPYKKK